MHELVVMPTKRMKPDESEYSVTCVVSPGTEGVKLLMKPRRMVGSSFEYPISHDEPGSECFVWFDDVFVPWERVIQNGEDWLSQPIARGLGLLLRYSALCSMKHYSEVLAGAAFLLAKYNGIDKAPHIRDHLFEFAMLASSMDALCNVRCHDLHNLRRHGHTQRRDHQRSQVHVHRQTERHVQASHRHRRGG